MNRVIRRAALAAALSSVAAAAQALPVSKLVVFGDSNVDIGRLDATLVAGDGSLAPPNTVAGRSGNGPLVPEYLAQRLGVPQLNFGWGGATTGVTNIVGPFFGVPYVTPTGAAAQIGEYEALLGGAAPDPKALHILWAGSNDLIFYDGAPGVVDRSSQSDTDAAVAAAIANIRDAAERLDAAGAQRIVITTRTPRPFLSDVSGPAAEPDDARDNDAGGRQLNDAIVALVAELQADLGADVLLFDDYALIREYTENPANFGFAPYDPTEAGYCALLPNDACDLDQALAATFINWDGAHKTTAVHSLLADAFIDQFGLTAAPTPIPAPPAILMSLSAFALLAARRRRAG